MRGALAGGVVEDEADHVAVHLADRLEAVVELVEVVLAVLHHEDEAGDLLGQDDGVGDHVDRRGVDDDVVKVLLDVGKQAVHLLGREQLRRIRRDLAGGQHVQIFGFRLADLDLFGQPGEDLGESVLVLHAEIAVNRRLAHIAVDQQNALRGGGDGDGEIDRVGRLAVMHHGAGNGEDRAFFAAPGKQKLGPDAVVGFADGERAGRGEHSLLGFELRFWRPQGLFPEYHGPTPFLPNRCCRCRGPWKQSGGWFRAPERHTVWTGRPRSRPSYRSATAQGRKSRRLQSR